MAVGLVAALLFGVVSRASAACTTTWKQVGVSTFPLPEGGLRSQGLTTDGHSWWFSWQYGLEHTTDSFADTALSELDIPLPLLMAGSNHIGDIDYYKGRLVIPIEDGSKYLHPYLALYNAQTLEPIEWDPVPRRLQTAGVPWVAVNAARGIAYTAEWNHAPQINEFAIDDHFRYLGSIKLQQTVDRIQGAKLLGDSLIASTDDAAKDVWQINLSTGAVTKLFALGLSGEQEGIGIRPGAGGSLLHILFIKGSIEKPWTYVGELHHFAPVGCPGA